MTTIWIDRLNIMKKRNIKWIYKNNNAQNLNLNVTSTHATIMCKIEKTTTKNQSIVQNKMKFWNLYLATFTRECRWYWHLLMSKQNEIIKSIKERVALINSYHLHFPHISKVWSMSHMGQWGEFRVKNITICLHIIFRHFLIFFFFKDNFHFFLWWSIKFRPQNINQSETGIGDKKLSLASAV